LFLRTSDSLRVFYAGEISPTADFALIKTNDETGRRDMPVCLLLFAIHCTFKVVCVAQW